MHFLSTLAVASATAGAPHADVYREVRDILSADWSGQARTEQEVLERLVGLGGDAIPELFALCAGESVSRLFEEGEVLDETTWFVDPSSFDGLFLRALGAQPPSTVVEHVGRRLREGSSHELRLSAVRVLGALGSAEGLALIDDLVKELGPLALRYRSVRGPLEVALRRIVDRDPAALLVVESNLEDEPTEFVDIVVEAVSTIRREHTLRVLEKALGRGPDLDARVLTVIAELHATAPWIFHDEAPPIVRPFLSAGDWRLRKAAAVSVARMRDLESFSRVVLLLEDEHASVQHAALRALSEIAGTSRFESPRDWLRWHDEQIAWWARNLDELRADLESDAPQVVMRAVRALVDRPLFRDEASVTLAAHLHRPEPGLVITICRALADLGSSRVVPDLLEPLQATNPAIRDAARSALGAITGQDLPAEHQCWSDYVQG
jgi:HEAT repeat protein